MALRVVHIPSLASMSANPYWPMLERGLRERGAKILEVQGFGAHWLRDNRGRIDVLHLHYIQSMYVYEHSQARLRWVLRFARNLLLARWWGYRVVFTLHNLTPSYPLEPVWVDYLGHWVAANLSSAVIVHCEAARRALRKRYGRRHRVYTVTHPHLAGWYANTESGASARSALGLVDGAMVYLYFGGLRPSKGVNALCRAFGAVDDPTAVLLIVGSSGGLPEVQREALRAEITADPRIRHVDEYVPDEEIQRYMNAADVVVLPFARVLTSSSAMLALSFGKPIIAPRMGCLPEMVTEGIGILYEPDDPEGLARALNDVRERDLDAMGENARSSVVGMTEQRFVDETLRAYGLEV